MATKTMAEYLREHKEDSIEIKGDTLYINGIRQGHSVRNGDYYRDEKSGDLIKMK